jgi:hypothetical protein
VARDPWNESEDFYTAETFADELIALHTKWDEIYNFGTQGVDIYYNDQVSPFRKLGGTNIVDGLGAAYSVQFFDKFAVYFSQDKQFQALEGRRPFKISTPWDKELQKLNVTSNIISHQVYIAGRTFYIASFPAEDLTLVYDTDLKQWYQWAFWNTEAARYERFRMNAYTFVPPWNKHLVGDYKTSEIYTMSEENYSDFGNPIRYLRRTGHISHDTLAKKSSSMLTIMTRRGTPPIDTETSEIFTDNALFSEALTDSTTVNDFQGPWEAGADEVNANLLTDQASFTSTPDKGEIMLRWRNQGGPWKKERWINIGKIGEFEHIALVPRMGRYRTRQYEIIHSGNGPFELINPIEEEMEVVE